MKTSPQLFLAVVAIFSLALAGSSQVTADHYLDPAQASLISGGSVITLDGRQVLKIENTNDAPLQVRLLTVDTPNIKSIIYQMSGEVRYDSVQGDGYLELWNFFPPLKPGLPEGEYFSRTLGENGPMGKISGTSDWRKFALPFDSTGASGPPTRLQLNLFLPARGTVYLGLSSVDLVQLPNEKSVNTAFNPHAWWTKRQSAFIGAWGGTIFGGLGGLVGLLAARRKARGLVVAILVMMSVTGFVCLIIGVVAIAQHQPYAVWYPLTLGGVLLTIVCPANLWMFLRRNQQAELRRMQALDVSGA